MDFVQGKEEISEGAGSRVVQRINGAADKERQTIEYAPAAAAKVVKREVKKRRCHRGTMAQAP